MASIASVINDLVIANRVLAHENVLDAYGHVSMRHPDDPTRFLLSRARSPELVEHDDILEYTLDGQVCGGAGHRPYVERFIHSAIYEVNPAIKAVVHSHALEVLPFSISSVPLRPVVHTASECGHHIPVWDIRDKFGDTTLLVVNQEQGRDLAHVLGNNRVALMRGHGFAAAGRSLGEVMKTSVYLPKNARVLSEALLLGGEVKYLSQGEITARDTFGPGGTDFARAWEYWAMRAGCGELLHSQK